MKRHQACLIGLVAMPGAAPGQPPSSLHMTYGTYAAGLEVAQVEAGLALGPRTYQMSLAYHTTGMAGLLFRGRQLSTVSGTWRGVHPAPKQYYAEGTWRGQQRVARIDYDQGLPIVRQLVPPNEAEREPVPDALRENAIDTLSAVAQLIREVGSSGRCETGARTFDGRRAVEIRASTAGEETLAQTGRSSFAGRALRCDFEGRVLSGFKLDADRDRDGRPMHGSAWLAPAVQGGPPVPVRLTFETRWFGDATMYLTGVASGSEPSARLAR